MNIACGARHGQLAEDTWGWRPYMVLPGSGTWYWPQGYSTYLEAVRFAEARRADWLEERSRGVITVIRVDGELTDGFEDGEAPSRTLYQRDLDLEAMHEAPA